MRNPTTPGSAPARDGRHARLREDFDFNDVNHDGRLTLGEFIRLMHNTDAEMTPEDLQIAFDEIDTNSDGLIEFAQFLTWWNEHL